MKSFVRDGGLGAVWLIPALLGGCGREQHQPDPVPADIRGSSTAPDHSLGTFVEPTTTGDYFGQPAGAGTLRICRSRENTMRDAAPIAAGTIFSDTGVIDQPPEQGGGWWLLWVQTTQSVSLAAGQDCVTAEARVIPSEVPANYADMQAVTRFNASDRRYFEIMSDGENLDRYPALLLMHATAQTDFH